ncbi:MAG: Gfo/Idh/MocA family oxidoreductase, partial [Candidatus Binatia bacterium]|nr:Gfo/Idh/MocA family oxidoreductase [Candidatus Binatia bacterium]
ALEFVKKCLQTRKLGKIYSIAHECGHYLPFWRKAEDYRKNYAAKKSTGGGIILDDVHEFDLLFWLNNFSAVKKRFLIFDHISDLRIETEDMSLAGYEFDNKVFGLVKSDYLQKYYSRSVKIVGEKGNLIWDYKENIVWFADEKRKNKLLTIKNYDSNEMYVRELEYFLNSVRTRKKTENDIAHARTVLKNCLP